MKTHNQKPKVSKISTKGQTRRKQRKRIYNLSKQHTHMDLHTIGSSVAGISSAVVGAIKDAGNPFLRLVHSVTTDSSTIGVPFYQSEQVKEVAFQSQNACETIHKGLHAKLDSTDDLVIRKTLDLCRILLLEGPTPQFQQLMFSQSSGKVLAIANIKKNDPNRSIPKDSVLEGNINLAAALHKGIVGDHGALASFGMGQQSRSAVGGQPASTSSSAATGSYKSDFQALQEREQKNFKKRREEERARNAGIVVTEKIHEHFDATLTPQKLVDFAVNHAKKKFSQEELENFVEAAEEGGRVEEVCAALDKVLRDGKSSIQSRYKVLTIVDVMIRNLAPALSFFHNNNVGIYRHVSLEAGDNPTKSAMMQQLASAMMDIVHGKVRVPASPPLAQAQPKPVVVAAQPPQQHQQQQQYSANTIQRIPTTITTSTPAPTATASLLTPEQKQMAEMMEKMKAMQAQLQAQAQAATTPAATTSSSFGSGGGGGWGGGEVAGGASSWGFGGGENNNTTSSSNGWSSGGRAVDSPLAAQGTSDWGSTKTPHNSFAMSPISSSFLTTSTTPVASAPQPQPPQKTAKKDPLDDLFDTSVPPPPTNSFLASAQPSIATNNAQAHNTYAEQLLTNQRSTDYMQAMMESGGEGVGTGVSHTKLTAVASGSQSEVHQLASEALKAMIEQQQQAQLTNAPASTTFSRGATAGGDDITEKLRQMSLLQQQFNLVPAGGGQQIAVVGSAAATAADPLSPSPTSVTPETSVITSPTDAYPTSINHGGGARSNTNAAVAAVAGGTAAAATSDPSDPLVQMRMMQAKMEQMMAAMAKQHGGDAAAVTTFATASPQVTTVTAAAEDDAPFSPTTYYKDPYCVSSSSASPAAPQLQQQQHQQQQSFQFSSSSSPNGQTNGFNNVTSPFASSPTVSASKRSTILRLMSVLEEQMAETRSIFTEQQQQMKRLQDALAKEAGAGATF